MASLYDTKQLVVYSIETKLLSFVKLPESSKGPIQMYPTPDSRFIYLADQGYYFGEPQGQWVYKIDLQKIVWPWESKVQEEVVVKEIKAGSGPHGGGVSHDGNFVYLTNFFSWKPTARWGALPA